MPSETNNQDGYAQISKVIIDGKMPSETNNQDGYATNNQGNYRWQDAICNKQPGWLCYKCYLPLIRSYVD